MSALFLVGYKSEVLRSCAALSDLPPRSPSLFPRHTMSSSKYAASALLAVLVAVISVADEAGASSISTRDSNGSKCIDFATVPNAEGQLEMESSLGAKFI